MMSRKISQNDNNDHYKLHQSWYTFIMNDTYGDIIETHIMYGWCGLYKSLNQKGALRTDLTANDSINRKISMLIKTQQNLIIKYAFFDIRPLFAFFIE